MAEAKQGEAKKKLSEASVVEVHKCAGVTKVGKQCTCFALPGSDLCRRHANSVAKVDNKQFANPMKRRRREAVGHIEASSNVSCDSGFLEADISYEKDEATMHVQSLRTSTEFA